MGAYVGSGTVVALSAEVGSIRDAIGVTPTDGVRLENTTAAALGAQQMSPRARWSGNAWETGGGTSQKVEWAAELLPVQAAAATSRWRLSSAENGGSFVERLSIDSTSQVIIDQRTADTAILKLQSNTDVVTALTTITGVTVETDDYAVFVKAAATTGGLLIQALGADAAVTTNFRLESYGGQADTTKSTAGRGLVEVYASQHNGANALANIAADGNVFAVRGRRGAADVALAIVDEDGDLWLGGGVTATTLTMTGALSVTVAALTATFTNSNDGASSQVAIFQGDRATPADNDAAYITFRLSDSAGTQDEGARITWQSTTVLDGGTQDTDLLLAAVNDGTLRTYITLDGSDRVVALGQATTITGAALTTATMVGSGGTALTVTGGAHTAVTAETINVSIAAQTIAITGSYATQRFVNIAQPTIATGAFTVTTGVTLNIASAPTVTGSAVVTNLIALRAGGAVTFAGAAATTYAAIEIPAHTITDTTTTGITAGSPLAALRINALTVAQSGGAVDIGTAVGLVIQSPTLGASVSGSSKTLLLGSNFTLNQDANDLGYIIHITNHTATLTTQTQVTGVPSFGSLIIGAGTINQSGGAVTVDSVATVYIAGALTAGGSVTLTSNYALWVDAGITRLDDHVQFGAGVAVVAATYSIGRDADGTNQMHFNTPTGATFEWSINDTAEATLSATALTLTSADLLVADTFGVVIGGTTQQTIGGIVPELQVTGAGGSVDSFIALIMGEANANGPGISFGKGRDALGTYTTVLSVGDEIGRLGFFGANGTDIARESARISVVAATGFASVNDTPGYLAFWTTPDGSNAVVHRLRVNSEGVIIIGSGELSTTAVTGNTLRAGNATTGGAGNIAGADFTIAAGLGTGTGDAGQIIFSLPIEAAAGDNIQTTAARLTLDMESSSTVLTLTFAQSVSQDVPTSATFEWTVNNVAEMTLSATALALGTNDLTLTGTIAATGARVTQSYHTNITSTNALTVDSWSAAKEDITPYAGDAWGIVKGMQIGTFRHLKELDPTGRVKLSIMADSVADPVATPVGEYGADLGFGPRLDTGAVDALLALALQRAMARIELLEAKLAMN